MNERKVVDKLIVCSKWKFSGGTLWEVYSQSAQFSFDVCFFFLLQFLKKQDADLDVEKVS